jgi:RNA polymerase-binding transcription factor DksA
MTQVKNVDEIRATLQAERARVMTSISHLQGEQEGGAHDQLERSGVEQDIGDRRIVLEQMDQAAQLATTEQELIEHIDAALARLDAGTYGTCASCEKPISDERLEALPWAIRCITCEEQASA